MVGRTLNLIDQGRRRAPQFPNWKLLYVRLQLLNFIVMSFSSQGWRRAWSGTRSRTRTLHYSSVHIMSSYFTTQAGGARIYVAPSRPRPPLRLLFLLLFAPAYQINQQINLPGARTPTSGATLSFISLLAEIYEPRAREPEKKLRTGPKRRWWRVWEEPVNCFCLSLLFPPILGLRKAKRTLLLPLGPALADQSAFIIYNSRRLAFLPGNLF